MKKLGFILIAVLTAAVVALGGYGYHIHDRVVELETNQAALIKPLQKEIKEFKAKIEAENVQILERHAKNTAEFTQQYEEKINNLSGQINGLRSEIKKSGSNASKIASLEKRIDSYGNQDQLINQLRQSVNVLDQKISQLF